MNHFHIEVFGMSNDSEIDMITAFDQVLRNEDDCTAYLELFHAEGNPKPPKHHLPDFISYPCLPVSHEVRSGSSYAHEFIPLEFILKAFTPEEIIDARPDLAACGADRLEEAVIVPQDALAPEGLGKVNAQLALIVARKPLELQKPLFVWDGKAAIQVSPVLVQGSISGVGQQLQNLVSKTMQAIAEDPQLEEVSHVVDDPGVQDA